MYKNVNYIDKNSFKDQFQLNSNIFKKLKNQHHRTYEKNHSSFKIINKYIVKHFSSSEEKSNRSNRFLKNTIHVYYTRSSAHS